MTFDTNPANVIVSKASPSERCRMDILSVPLSRFVEYLDSAREFDRTHPALSQEQWLLDSFSFDDTSARYEPPMKPWPTVDRAAWWWRTCRN